MQWVRMLHNIAHGKNCAIIAGGTSVNDYDLSLLPDNYIKIVLNNAEIKGINFDYRIFFDPCVIKLLKKINLKNEKLIGFSNAYYPRVNYCYTLNEFERLGYPVNDWDNIGLKALILVKKIFNPDSVFLFGYDFYLKNGTSHFYGDKIGENEKYNMPSTLEDHKKKLPEYCERFDIVSSMENVYNCNEQSKLKIFPYALPRELNPQSA